MRATALLSFLSLWAVTESVAIPASDTSNVAGGGISNLLSRAATDPTDFSWVKRWAAVGDSFTAGIGSGTPLGSIFSNGLDPTADWYCARYDQSYPIIVNDALGPSVESFQFTACSGDRTGGIYKQIQDMSGNLDLVIMTAGGNDLCLSSMILKCVFRSFDGEDACDSVLEIAQTNLDTILKPNLVQLMEALNAKMNSNSVVVFNGYAQFFNTQNEDCATEQDWSVYNIFGSTPLPLTVARRKKFNNLVVQINSVIKTVVEETAKNSTYKYTVGFSNWDPWPSSGVNGQFCDPSSTGVYPDDSQPDLQFFKRNTNIPEPTDPGDLKKRAAINASEELPVEVRRRNQQDEIYNSLLYKSQNPQADVKHKLDWRAPAPPLCPGDKDVDIQDPSYTTPNFLGKNFHPNELGHYTIASWSLQTIMDLRAEVLNVAAPSCPAVDKFSCYQKTEGYHRYASAERLNSHLEDFCDKAQEMLTADPTEDNIKIYYDSTTPDEMYFRFVFMANKTTTFDHAECVATMNHIINACDAPDAKNPMGWKFGGEWQRGDRFYQVAPMFVSRPWPVVQKPKGRCTGWYHIAYSSYEIEGAGFSDYDYGGETLKPHIKSCIGSDPSSWKFEYYREPNENGYEWKATFDTPIWVRSRCFRNNKVVQEIGGWTDGCAGND
ncbi:hypothetical protein V490_07060 [Pseudogymnoascus sp. VKM F-3557]|nr:hypothetical protein V490_07060 [Pseudogymnoascus sp. VKM F-3557]